MPSHHASKLVAICRRALLGEYSVVEAARLISTLAHDLDPDSGDSDLNLFRAIDSETDHLPVGHVRDRWQKEALAKRGEELAKVESFYSDAAADSYRALLERYDETV